MMFRRAFTSQPQHELVANRLCLRTGTTPSPALFSCTNDGIICDSPDCVHDDLQICQLSYTLRDRSNSTGCDFSDSQNPQSAQIQSKFLDRHREIAHRATPMSANTSIPELRGQYSTKALTPMKRAKGPSRLDELRESLASRSFFDDDNTALQILKRAFSLELDYLKTSYATTYPGSSSTHTPSPSLQLFDCPWYHEVNRTVTGVLALIWIFRNDYKAFTHNQNEASRLDQISFERLRAYYADCLDDFNDTNALLALVVMQMTNDLGKSRSLVTKLMGRLPSGMHVSNNHDMIMFQVLQYAPELIPCLKSLDSGWQHTVCRLVKLSATFNPGQFVQGECQPVALESLQDGISQRELDMKFMEMFLDLSGASGHRNHEGAASMTETAFQGFMQAKTLSHEVVAKKIDTQGAYTKMLEWRLDICKDATDELFLTVDSETRYALARLLCMGRVLDHSTAEEYRSAYDRMDHDVRSALTRSLNCYQAESYRGDLVNDFYDDGERCMRGIQATYAPGMLALVRGQNMQNKLCAFFTYLSHVSTIHMRQLAEDMKMTEDTLMEINVKVVERDIRCLEPVLTTEDDDFSRDPWVALQGAGIPPAQVTAPIL